MNEVGIYDNSVRGTDSEGDEDFFFLEEREKGEKPSIKIATENQIIFVGNKNSFYNFHSLFVTIFLTLLIIKKITSTTFR